VLCLRVQCLLPVFQALLDAVIGRCADARGEFGVLGAQLVLDRGLGPVANGDPVARRSCRGVGEDGVVAPGAEQIGLARSGLLGQVVDPADD
jgi:hypothetical protein